MRALPIALSAALLVAPMQLGAPLVDARVAAVEPAAPLEAAESRIAMLPASPSEPEPAPAAAPAWRAETAVLASWYGPGFWENRTACGQILTPALLGVAHRTLPCGTLVTLRHGGATLTMPVVDNGPHVPGREFDLTHRARVALGCPDLCRLGWVR